jgi:ribosome-binding factor A
MARVNELLREVVAEEIELLAAADNRLELLTVTAVNCDPDLRHAKVLFATLADPALAALGDVRPRLQKAVAQQVKLKRTPQLSFERDPAIEAGAKVEEILRAIQLQEQARGRGADQEPLE